MYGRQFLLWASRAPADARADAALALARAYLCAEPDPIEQGEMQRAMMCLLDDPSPLVRRALADAFADAADAPYHVVAALAGDQADIAALVLSRSPLLVDADLIDAAALGKPLAQRAIAGRPNLSAAVAGALAEVGAAEAVLTLCANDGAVLADVSIVRILERFGADGAIREALARRHGLSAELRHRLALATADALWRFTTACRWISPERARRLGQDATERVALDLAEAEGERGDAAGQLRFANYLRRTGRLTPAFMLRALLSGQLALFEAALSEMSGQPLRRVIGLVHNASGLGFAALCRACGLSEAYLPVIRAALDGSVRAETGARPAIGGLKSRLVARVIDACEGAPGRSITGLAALLRRFEAEALRAESRVEHLAAAEPSLRAAPIQRLAA